MDEIYLTRGPKPMSLLKKILAITSIFLIIWIGIMVYLMENIVMKSYVTLENKNIQQKAQVLDTSIEFFLTRLNPILDDWANWDDAYDYIENPNPKFIKSNIPQSIFKDLNINYIVITDFKGNTLYNQGFNLNTEDFVDVPDVFITESIKNLNNSGFIYHDAKPLVFTSSAITDSNGEKAPNGIITFGYYLNPAFISETADSMGIDININSYNSQLNPSGENRVIITTKNATLIRDYIPYVNENSYLVLESSYPNEITLLGRRITNNAIIFFVVLFLCLTLLMHMALRNTVARILKLNFDVGQIINSDDIGLRVKVSGDDELAVLKNNINKMLDKIELMNAELMEYATFDVMTGVFNRRAGMNKLKRFMKDSVQMGYPLSIAFIDVNNLKFVNDRYGHNLGDQLLIHVSSIIRANTRKSDVFFRLGGDEFLIIFPNATEKEAVMTIERVREDMAKINDENSLLYELSISVGIQQHNGQIDLEEFIELADVKMYQDKVSQKMQRE